MQIIKVNAWADARGVRRVAIVATAVAVDKSEKGGGADISEPPIRAIAGSLVGALKIVIIYIHISIFLL